MGQASAITLFRPLGSVSLLRWRKKTTLSARGFEAHFLMFRRRAFFVTATKMTRARLRRASAAFSVRRTPRALPSEKTTTTFCTPFLPPTASSCSTAPRAVDVSAVAFGHASRSMPMATASVLLEKWLTQRTLHSAARSTFPWPGAPPAWPVQRRYAAISFGPLYRRAATCEPPSCPDRNILESSAAASCTASQPSWPRLLLPSSAMTTSSLALHWRREEWLGMQGDSLQRRY
mmetsp:Transcript_36669/g.108962  ORF Transcript_36669/g.108962 Transcript_36669/m.108962 type:complete len:233 (+) Transcript_36669:77-775(+)